MIGIAEITSNYWYWDYTPTAFQGFRNTIPIENKLQSLCQDAFAEFDEDIRARGLSRSGLHINARTELTYKLGRSPVSWRRMIGLN